MKLLLNIHVVLWWPPHDETLSEEVTQSIDTEAGALINAASVVEIATTQALGKLDGPPDLLDVLDRTGLVERPWGGCSA